MERNDKPRDYTGDNENGHLFDRPQKTEKDIFEELRYEGILPDNGCNKKNGLAYYFSINDGRGKENVRRKPPRLLDKLDNNSSYNKDVKESKFSEEKMNAAELQHREYLRAKGESARLFEERYAKLKERRKKKEAEKRKRIEEKLDKADKIRKGRDKCLPTTMARVLRVQERREVQQNKMLEKFQQKWKRDDEKRKLIQEKNTTACQFNTLKQRLDVIESKINPVELILKNSHYPDSPQVSP